MGDMIVVKLVVCFLFSFTLWATPKAELMSNSFYDSYYLGEDDFKEFFGAVDPLRKWDHGERNFVEDLVHKSLIEDRIDQSLISMERWISKLPKASQCSNFNLNKNNEYIRYIYRLLAISYTFEGLKDYHKFLYRLNGDSDSCSLSWDHLFSKCSPKYSEMKKFRQRANVRRIYEVSYSKLKPISDDEIRFLLDSLKKKRKTVSNISHSRIISKCSSSSCADLSKEKLVKYLIGFCKDDIKFINKLCNENDDLFGASYIEEFKSILHNGHAFKNQKGASVCVERFSSEYQAKEGQYDFLNAIVPIVSYKLSQDDERYLQGSLFIPGSLKYFDDMGLKDFLFKAPKSTPIPVIVKAKPKPTKIPFKISKSTPIPVPTKIIIKKKNPPKIKVPKLAEFEKAVIRQRKSKDKFVEIDVDMSKLGSEYKFPPALFKSMNKPLLDFQSREALTDMKTYDKLGSKQEPVRLKFVKFLIDKKYHQGLYNIVSIIGDKFYTLNDFDNKKEPVFIKIYTSKKMNNEWQISILKSPTDAELKAMKVKKVEKKFNPYTFKIKKKKKKNKSYSPVLK